MTVHTFKAANQSKDEYIAFAVEKHGSTAFAENILFLLDKLPKAEREKWEKKIIAIANDIHRQEKIKASGLRMCKSGQGR